MSYLKKPQKGKVATTGQIGTLVDEFNNLGQVYGQGAPKNRIPSIVHPLLVTSATDYRGFYFVKRYLNPRAADPTGDAVESDLGQGEEYGLGLYAPEINGDADPLKADETEYAAGLFLNNSTDGVPVYQLLMSNASSGSAQLIAQVIDTTSLARPWYHIQFVEKTTDWDETTIHAPSYYWTATGASFLAYNLPEFGSTEPMLDDGTFVEVVEETPKLDGTKVYRIVAMSIGCGS